MSEEENKAIERLKLSIDMVDKKWKLEITNSNKLKTILNIIEKQQKEIKELNLENQAFYEEMNCNDNEYISKN